MKYIPILFSTPMVKAILNDTKSQTRRIIKPQPDFDSAWKNYGNRDGEIPNIHLDGPWLGVSKGKGGMGACVPNIRIKAHVGDVFWVRETFAKMFDIHPELIGNDKEDMGYWYKADGGLNEAPFYIEGHKWKPSIFMPKDACRIFLEVTNVRVERLWNISALDAVKEGIKKTWFHDDPIASLYKNYINNGKGSLYPTHSFFSLWESINGKESLDSNPWVWVYDFKKIDKPDNFN